MYKKTSNKDARKYVQQCIQFKGSNTFSELLSPNQSVATWRYVVYSYGYHYPMFVAEWANGLNNEPTWYANADKYSQSTSKQMSQLHPLVETVSMSTQALKTLVNNGIAGIVSVYAQQGRE